MKFWKMNGAGNDFIIIDNRVEKISHDKLPQVAKTLCERHLSIGADGFMVVEASAKADYRMIFFNSDGSVGEMCGNGARCIARYGYENKLAGDVQRVETDSGVVVGHRIEKRLYKVRLNNVTLLERRDLDVDGKLYECTYVELGMPGLPHAVVPIDGLVDYPHDKLFELGRKMRYHKAFPKGANVNFYEIVEKDHVTVRTWERGVEDFTFACGTGSGSVATVLTLAGKASGRNVKIDMPGGQLIIDVERTGEHIDNLYLTGPTNIVCKGEVTDEELSI
ncbi:MAG: diaminopimelate epimerase [Victivallales bacterium]|nr:diaminopimelate epimerase [Victivallales bacterium]